MGASQSSAMGFIRRLTLAGGVALASHISVAGSGLPQEGGQAVSRTTPEVERTVYDMERLAQPPELSEMELAGRRLFVQRCAICHDPLGQPGGQMPGPWLDQGTLERRGADRVRGVIETGTPRMPGFQYALDPEQIDQLLSYLATVTPDERPQ